MTSKVLFTFTNDWGPPNICSNSTKEEILFGASTLLVVYPKNAGIAVATGAILAGRVFIS